MSAPRTEPLRLLEQRSADWLRERRPGTRPSLGVEPRLLGGFDSSAAAESRTILRLSPNEDSDHEAA